MGIAAAGGAALASAAQAAEPASTLLPTVALGPHKVTRLIVGGNPVYGYSHFNRHFDKQALRGIVWVNFRS